MTTIREHFEQGHYFPEFIEFFHKNYGHTPMCCFSCQKKKGKWMFKCCFLNEWLSEKDFERKCLQCQGEMKEMLKEHGY